MLQWLRTSLSVILAPFALLLIIQSPMADDIPKELPLRIIDHYAQKPTTQTPAQRIVSTEIAKDDESKSNSYLPTTNQQFVKIIDFPDITVKRSLLDYGLLFASVLLFATGALQVIFARLSHRANRPFIVTEDFQLTNFTSFEQLAKVGDDVGLKFMVVNFAIKNEGRGPAIISGVKGALKIVDGKPDNLHGLPEPIDDLGNLSECENIGHPKVIASSSKSIVTIVYKKGLPSHDDYCAVRNWQGKHVVVYGQIIYRDVASKRPRCRTGFGMAYIPHGMVGPEHFKNGPEQYNYNT